MVAAIDCSRSCVRAFISSVSLSYSSELACEVKINRGKPRRENTKKTYKKIRRKPIWIYYNRAKTVSDAAKKSQLQKKQSMVHSFLILCMDGTIPPISETVKSPRKKRFGIVVYILLFFILTAVVIGVGIRLTSLLGNKEEEDSDITIVTISPTETLFPTDTPAPLPTETAKPTIKPTSAPTPTKSAPTPTKTSGNDNTTGLDRSDLSIAIFNGSGETGAASKMSTFLKDLGYTIASTGNADNFDYQKVTIRIKSGKSDYLALLKKDLEASYTVGLTSEDLTATSSADANVIVGSQ